MGQKENTFTAIAKTGKEKSCLEGGKGVREEVTDTIFLSPKVGFKVVDVACFVFFVHIFGFSGLFKLVLSTLLTIDISFLSFSNLDPLTETVSFKKKS